MAQKVNLILDQGTDFESSLLLEDEDGVVIDLTGFTGRSEIRRHHTSLNATATFVVTVANTGTVTLAMDANTTANVISGRYVYDVELISGTGKVSRVFEGQVKVTPEVTR